MHTVLRNQWVGVFILKEETCRLPGRAKGIMLHFFTTNSNEQNFIART